MNKKIRLFGVGSVDESVAKMAPRQLVAKL
jgi:hypothetical protein